MLRITSEVADGTVDAPLYGSLALSSAGTPTKTAPDYPPCMTPEQSVTTT